VAHIKLIVEYDGAGFHGWQKQPNLRTVQSELERALSVICREQAGPLHAAGRTDSGVHARGQVVTFFVDNPPPMHKLVAGVSHLLKGELSVISAEIVPDAFHPGISSTHKQYTYRILNRPAPPVLEARRVWHLVPRLDVARMRKNAQELVGTHDFSSFRDSECCATSRVKTVYEIEVVRTCDLIEIRVVGDGFLKQMVRNIVGTLVDLELSRLQGRTMAEIFASKDRRLAGVTAPAHGLCMEWVSYDSVPERLLLNCAGKSTADPVDKLSKVIQEKR
jgi:tRNA pseudouridine38-40 synthase